MAEGVKIRIVGDDSEFIAMLENLEKRVRGVLSGGGALSPLSAVLSQALQGLGTVTLNVAGDLASGIAGQQGEAEHAADTVAGSVRRVLQDRMGAYNAGVQMSNRYRAGMLSRRAAVIAAAQSIASAASGALQGNAPSGAGVGSPQRAMALAAYLPAEGVSVTARPAAAAPAEAVQPIYLNVDGRTLAQVIAGDMHRSLNRRSRSMDMGIGR